MPAPAPMRYLSLTVARETMDEHRRTIRLDTPEPGLNLALPSGSIRRVPLDRRQLIAIIADAAAALRALEK